MENLMVNNSILKNLKHSLLITALVFISAFHLNAQALKPASSIKLQGNAHQVSIDRQGNIYVAASNGDIDRYDRQGLFSKHFSPTKKAQPTLLEAWQGLRTFVFYQDFQEYLFLDRFLSQSERYELADQKISSTISLATIAADNNLWTFDNQNLSLKKMDLQNGEIISDTNLNFILKNKTHEFTYMREYQNLLFLSDKKEGVLVFDNIGNHIETLPLMAVNHFSFSGTKLITLFGDKLVTFELYAKEKKRGRFTRPLLQLCINGKQASFSFHETKTRYF